MYGYLTRKKFPSPTLLSIIVHAEMSHLTHSHPHPHTKKDINRNHCALKLKAKQLYLMKRLSFIKVH